jgi:glycerol 2-dehydrogenase (NADP+)
MLLYCLTIISRRSKDHTHSCRSCVQQDVVDYCTSRGIALTAYSPLGSNDSPLLKNAIVLKLAEKYNVQPANILISLQANRPHVTGETGYWINKEEYLNSRTLVLTKSVTLERILCKFLSPSVRSTTSPD